MLLKIFTVRDAKTEAYMQPFFAPTRGSAIRSFTDAVQDEKHEFYRHAADYALFEIGVFDDGTGAITTDVQPIHLGNALDFQKEGA